MDNDNRSDEVRRRMSALRSELEGDVQNVTDSARAVAENARAMADWRYFVRRFPFAVAGVAVAAGFFAVPRRSQTIVPDAETLAALAKMNQVWVKTGSPKSADAPKTMLGALVALAASGVTRFAIHWATAQFKSSLAAAGERAGATQGGGRAVATHEQVPAAMTTHQQRCSDGSKPA